MMLSAGRRALTGSSPNTPALPPGLTVPGSTQQCSCLLLFLLVPPGCAVGTELLPLGLLLPVHPLSASGLPEAEKGSLLMHFLREILPSWPGIGRLASESLGLRDSPHTPRMKVATTLALPPLPQSQGNLFPGPSRLSRPWPA